MAKLDYGEEYSYKQWTRHFNDHVYDIIDAKKKATRIRDQFIDDFIDEEVAVGKRLLRNLQRLDNQMELLVDMEDPEVRKEMRDIIFLLNKTIEINLRFIDKLEVQPKHSEEEIYKKVMKIIKDFPREYLILFTQKWNELKDE